jgi:hypothetical protein
MRGERERMWRGAALTLSHTLPHPTKSASSEPFCFFVSPARTMNSCRDAAMRRKSEKKQR